MYNKKALARMMPVLIIVCQSICVSPQATTQGFFPDSLRRIVLIQPTGETVNDLPEMVPVDDTSALYRTVAQTISNSFINEFLDIYFAAQVYLKNQGELDSIEPAYIALTNNQGGFAKFGFSLKMKNGTVLKRNSAYVDIVLRYATEDPSRLMSITQLYPHEMGHILVHLLCPEDTVLNNTRSTDVHFFSIITDYSTAFNEGFAEHIENVSRLSEKNENIRSGIFSDIENIGKTSQHFTNGFERDFKFPFRLGFFKTSMIGWYQRFEDYKRYECAINKEVRHKSAVLKLRDPEDQISFRNSGVKINRNEIRNMVQMHATEGAVNSFFTHLSTSSLPGHFLDPEFYKPFLLDSTLSGVIPQELFTQIQNQFVKYLYILDHYVVSNNSQRSQLTDFIDGYIQSFPEEADTVRKIFREVFGQEFTNQLPPPLWLLVKEHSHRVLIYDLFNAITVPVYTFDLNAAEAEDIQTIKGVTRKDAETIISYRNANGCFTDLSQLNYIQGLPQETAIKIISSAFDPKYFEDTLTDFEMNLDIFTLVKKLFTYIMFRGIVSYFLIFWIIYLALIRTEKRGIKRNIFLFLKMLLLWILLIIAGQAAVVFSQIAYVVIIALSLLMCAVCWLLYRKRTNLMYRSLITVGLMGLAIGISVF
jgi:competence ComEA-like helix-hairpin-helix protein